MMGKVVGALRLTTAALVVFILSDVVSPPGQAQTPQKWHGSLDALGRGGSDNQGMLDLFQPLYQTNDTLLFGNAIGGLDSDSSNAANFGLGVRHMVDGNYILGAYGYFDWLHSPNSNTFYQATAGVEAMTRDWDFRVNGYIPFGGSADLVNIPKIDGVAGTTGDGPPVVAVQGNEIGLLREGTLGMPGQNGLLIQERPLGGIEGEVGYRLPFGNLLGNDSETRLFLGGYAFWGDGYPTYAGPRGRLEFRVYDLSFLGEGSRLTAGAEVAWDDPRGVQGEGSLRLRIPLNFFGGGAHTQLSELDRRMVDPVPIRVLPVYAERQEVSIAAPGSAGGSTFEAVKDTETGREIVDIYFAKNGGTSGNAGTQGNATDLTDAITRAGTNGLVVLDGAGGNVSGTFGLLEGQILLGGASSLSVTGLTSGVTLTYMPGLTRPTVTYSGPAGGAIVSNNVQGLGHIKIQGVDFDASGSAPADQILGVAFQDSSNNIVRDSTINGAFGGLIVDETDAAGSGNDLFENLHFTNNSFVAMQFEANAGSGTLSNITVNNTDITGGGRGIVTTAPNGTFVDGIKLNTITIGGGSGSAILLANTKNITIDGVTGNAPANAAARGLTIQGSSGSNNIMASNVSFTGYGVGLLTFDVSNATFNNFTIKDSGQLGVDLTRGANISLTNSTVSGTGSLGALSDTAVRLTNINGVKVQNVAIDGKNTAGDSVTDIGFVLQAVPDGIGLNMTIDTANSTGNTVINTTARCQAVQAGGGVITGSIAITTPVASTCP